MNKQQIIELAQRALDAAQAMPDDKPLKGRIYDLEYKGECWWVRGDGRVLEFSVRSGSLPIDEYIAQGRAFYDEESAELFSRAEQIRFRLLAACKAECKKAGWEPNYSHGENNWFLCWEMNDDCLTCVTDSFTHVNDFIMPNGDVEHFNSIKSQFTAEELKLAITGME